MEIWEKLKIKDMYIFLYNSWSRKDINILRPDSESLKCVLLKSLNHVSDLLNYLSNFKFEKFEHLKFSSKFKIFKLENYLSN